MAISKTNPYIDENFYKYSGCEYLRNFKINIKNVLFQTEFVYKLYSYKLPATFEVLTFCNTIYKTNHEFFHTFRSINTIFDNRLFRKGSVTRSVTRSTTMDITYNILYRIIY